MTSSTDLPPTPVAPPARDLSMGNIKTLVGCLLGAFCAPQILMISAIAVVMGPLSKEFGWTRAQISGAISLMLFLSALMTAFWGGVIDKQGVRKVIAGGTAGVGLAVLALAFTDRSLIWFYVCFCALALTGSTGVGYSKLIGSLFSKNRGKALAVFGMESTLVGAVVPPLLYGLLQLYGWRGMFAGIGVIILAIAPVLLVLLQEPGATGRKGAKPVFEGLTGPETRRTREFWFMNFATMFGNLTATGLLAHLVGVTISHGMPASVAVAALSIQTVAIALGQVLGGFMLDRVDTPKIAVPSLRLLALAGLITLALATPDFGGAPMLLTGAFMLGFGNGAKRSMNTYFQTRFFGLKALAENSGWSIAITSFVLAPAPLLFGLIFDRTKSYDLALWIVGGGLAVALVFYMLLRPYRYTAAATPIPAPENAGVPATA